MPEISQLLNKAREAAVEAGQAIMNVYESGEFALVMKKDQSPLTIADKKSNQIIVECLSQTKLPILSEEEMNTQYQVRKNWEYFWLIDPLDGTHEFIDKIEEFTVNIALIREGKPSAGIIYAPLQDILYGGSQETGALKFNQGVSTVIRPLSERIRYEDLRKKVPLRITVSRSHLSPETRDFINQFENAHIVSSGSSIKFMLLLEGRADIYPRFGNTMEWDTAAAHAILNACNRGIYRTDLKSELTYNKPDLTNPFFIAF